MGNHRHIPKRISRFIYHGDLPGLGEILQLSVAESGHLRKVLRLDVGDVCMLANARGAEAEAAVESFSSLGLANLKIIKNRNTAVKSSKTRIHVYQSFALKGKMDFLIEKSQEIGIDQFTPILSEHCALKPSQDVQKKLLSRWQKKIEQAIKQSGNLTGLFLTEFEVFQNALKAIEFKDNIIVFHPLAEGKTFKEWMTAENIAGKKNLHLFFGAEGGFSEREIDWLKKFKETENKNIDIVSLGSNILRFETAFLGVSTAMRLLLA